MFNLLSGRERTYIFHSKNPTTILSVFISEKETRNSRENHHIFNTTFLWSIFFIRFLSSFHTNNRIKNTSPIVFNFEQGFVS